MAWQQQQQGSYDNYGGYVDPGYGQNDQQNQYYSNPSAGMVSVTKKECRLIWILGIFIQDIFFWLIFVCLFAVYFPIK